MHILLIRQIIETLQKFLFLAISMQALSVSPPILGDTPGGVDDLEDDEGAVRSQ